VHALRQQTAVVVHVRHNDGVRLSGEAQHKRGYDTKGVPLLASLGRKIAMVAFTNCLPPISVPVGH
jgi:hypothetical protein